ncbi:uncharacterized protein [Setaria viridis]|uniref:uncharacterized protein n=1 Tax=Setaria viridis TaxID=4556 RepID=UPI003B3AF657
MVLSDSKIIYTEVQKLLHAILITSRKLPHYCQAHKIRVVSVYPISEILHNRDVHSRVVKWSVELKEFDIDFCPHHVIKSQIQANFVAEVTKIQEPPSLERSKHLTMYFDGALNLEGAGAGVLFISPKSEQLKYVLQIHYKATNNDTEYEALIHGLRIAALLGIKHILAFGDSKVVIEQVNKS